MSYSFDDLEKFEEEGRVFNGIEDIKDLFEGFCGEFIDEFDFDKFMNHFDYIDCYKNDGKYYLYQKFICDFDVNDDDVFAEVIENCEK